VYEEQRVAMVDWVRSGGSNASLLSMHTIGT
jgi:hypothetical protein